MTSIRQPVSSLARILFPTLFTLTGCASLDTVQPYTVELRDPGAFARDLSLCRAYAAAYKPGLSVSSIGNATAQGGLGNAAGAALNPLIPAAGALGGGGSELLREIGLLTTEQRSILIDCLKRKGDKSGAYFTLQPTG